jgi:spermidine synthase
MQRPFALELDYTQDMMLPLLLRPERDWPRNALLIGLGAASQSKFLYRHRPRAALTVVEIEPKVVAAAASASRSGVCWSRTCCRAAGA